MTYRMDALVDESPETVVRVPEAEPRRLRPASPGTIGPGAAPAVTLNRTLPRSTETPWLVAAIAVVAVATVLVWVFRPTTPDLTRGNAIPPAPVAAGPGAGEPAWAAQTIPVPDALRTHTVIVNGSVDLLALTSSGAGGTVMGASVTADGPVVRTVYGDRAFSVASPSGATIIVFLTYPSGDQPVLEAGDEVTFQGTVMPVPPDFEDMVGASAASVARSAGVYVNAVPVTVQLATAPPA
jgi:hypothetical protein